MSQEKNPVGLSEFNEANQLSGNMFTPPIMIDPLQEDPRPSASELSAVKQKTDKISTIDKVEDRVAHELNNQKFSGAPANPLDALKRMITTGLYDKVIRAFGVTWKLRALDQADLIMAYNEVTDDVNTFIGRMTIVEFVKLVYSIEEIDGTSIYEIFSEVKMSDYPNNKVAYIYAVKRLLQRYLEGLAPVILDVLYDEYKQVEVERTKALEPLKNS